MELLADWLTVPALLGVLGIFGILLLYFYVRVLWLEHELRAARREVDAEIAEWRLQHERSIRRDAVRRSQAVTVGKVTEHLAPFLPDFPYNPKDARFVGSPIDFVVFDGLNENDLRGIVFLEVKTGTAVLNPREKQVREAVLRQCVQWEEFRVPVTAAP